MPRRIKDYTVDWARPIGEGQFGKVFKACMPKGPMRALKAIDISNDVDKYIEEMIEQEAQILSMLDHKNIIKFDCMFKQKLPPRVYIVTELVQYGNLENRIISKNFYTEGMGRDIFREILRAVHYLHSKKIVHGDLKPENVLMASLTSDTEIKLIDFGFSQIADGNNLTKYRGTPCYMAPEFHNQLQLSYGKPVDMWALGAILFYLLSGKHAFPYDTVEGINRAVKEDEVVFPQSEWAQVSHEAKSLVLGLLHKDAQQRLTVELALAHSWFGAEEANLDHPLEANINMIDTQAKPKLLGPVNWVIFAQRFVRKYRQKRQSRLDAETNDKSHVSPLCSDHDSSTAVQGSTGSGLAEVLASAGGALLSRQTSINSSSSCCDDVSLLVRNLSSDSRAIHQLQTRSVSPAIGPTISRNAQALTEHERELTAIKKVFERYTPREWDLVRRLPEQPAPIQASTMSPEVLGGPVAPAPAGLGLLRSHSSNGGQSKGFYRQHSNESLSVGMPHELVTLAKYSSEDLQERLLELEGYYKEGELTSAVSTAAGNDTV